MEYLLLVFEQVIYHLVWIVGYESLSFKVRFEVTNICLMVCDKFARTTVRQQQELMNGNKLKD